MAFDKLKKLGDDKMLFIKNALMRGTPAMALARTIQSEWGEFEGVGEKTLTQMLQRFKNTLIEEGLGDEAKKVLEETGKVSLKLMGSTSINALRKMCALAEMQEVRIQKAWDKEQQMGGIPLGALNVLVNDYKEMLKDIQKMQFDLGVDEYKGLVGGRLLQDTLKLPDGSIQQRTIMEAFETVQGVFKKRGIHLPAETNGTNDSQSA